jgi:hypothetical protein
MTATSPTNTYRHSPVDMPDTLGGALRGFLAHPSPRILLVLVTFAVAVRLSLGGFAPRDLLTLAIVAAYWPIQEWLIHVFVLHYRPVKIAGRTLDFPVPRKHRAHHRDPWDAALIFIPLHSYVYTVPILFGAWLLFAPTTALAFTGLSVHLLLTLHYEWVHYLVHTRVVPKRALYKRLWRNHRLHHFKNEHYWYGVTMLTGDHVLRTAPDRDAVPSSPTARDLLGETVLATPR